MRKGHVLAVLGAVLAAVTVANGYTFIKAGWPVAEPNVTAESPSATIAQASGGQADSAAELDFNRLTCDASPGIGLTSYPFAGCVFIFR